MLDQLINLIQQSGQAQVVNNPAITAAPTFSPVPGNYPSTISLSLSCATPGAQIYFTNNGITPSNTTPAARLYSTPFNVSNNGPIKAIAYRSGFQNSPISVGNYSFGPVRLNVNEESSAFYYEQETFNQVEETFNLSVYPNPSSGRFQLILSGEKSKGEVILFNSIGKQLFKLDILQDEFFKEINLSGYPVGIYNLVYVDASGRHEIKLSKE
jgi:hypothetical protein